MTLKSSASTADDPLEGSLGAGEPADRDADVVLTTAGRAFRGWLEERQYAHDTVRQYVHYLERAAIALDAIGTTLDAASAQDLDDWWRSLKQTAPTRNAARKSLVAYYRSIGRKRGEPADELPGLPEGSRLPRPVTVDAFARLRLAAVELGGVHEVIGLLLASTGCRISEARLARWAQFELSAASPVWWISGKGSGRRGKKERVLPLTVVLVEVLARWRRECPSTVFVFPSDLTSTGAICDSTMRTRIGEIVDHAGLEKVVPHRWRHSWATAALEQSGDLSGVQELLGHANPATTRLYTQVSPDRLRSIVDALPT